MIDKYIIKRIDFGLYDISKNESEFIKYELVASLGDNKFSFIPHGDKINYPNDNRITLKINPNERN